MALQVHSCRVCQRWKKVGEDAALFFVHVYDGRIYGMLQNYMCNRIAMR